MWFEKVRRGHLFGIVNIEFNVDKGNILDECKFCDKTFVADPNKTNQKS